MAKNFKIAFHRNSDNLHFKLVGDFDGSSAQELVNALKKYGAHASRVFIHTSCLRNIHPFGRNVFRSELGGLNSKSVAFVFTGENASQLAPEKTRVFQNCHTYHPAP